MKKWMSMLLALTMLLTAGCGAKGEEEEKQTPPSGLYYDITGVDPREAALEVDGNALPMELYCYWIAYACSDLEYQLGMANAYYGAYGELFDENGKLKWDADFQEGKSLSRFVREQTENTLKLYAVIENVAKEQGIALTEEDKAAMTEERAAAVEQMGGQAAFETYLEKLGISLESFDRMAQVSKLYEKLLPLVTEADSPLYLAEEDYDQYATYADHILLTTVDLATQQPLSDEEVAAKRATAEDLVAQLEAAEDLPALFAQLADEYSEDTGRATNPNGYVYTPGTMVQPFEDAASALEPGQISGIVETDYGFHIILRKNLQEGLASDETMRNKLVEEHLNALLQLEVEGAQVTTSEVLETIDPGTFYTEYSAALEALAQAETDAAAGETATEGETDNQGGSTEDGTAE